VESTCFLCFVLQQFQLPLLWYLLIIWFFSRSKSTFILLYLGTANTLSPAFTKFHQIPLSNAGLCHFCLICFSSFFSSYKYIPLVTSWLISPVINCGLWRIWSIFVMQCYCFSLYFLSFNTNTSEVIEWHNCIFIYHKSGK